MIKQAYLKTVNERMNTKRLYIVTNYSQAQKRIYVDDLS